MARRSAAEVAIIDKYLQENYQDKGAYYCASKFSETIQYIRGRACNLDLQDLSPGNMHGKQNPMIKKLIIENRILKNQNKELRSELIKVTHQLKGYKNENKNAEDTSSLSERKSI